jgi:hypothetical protein
MYLRGVRGTGASAATASSNSGLRARELKCSHPIRSGPIARCEQEEQCARCGGAGERSRRGAYSEGVADAPATAGTASATSGAGLLGMRVDATRNARDGGLRRAGG